MLKKLKLRALVPGQWARTRIPDFECWRESKGFAARRPGGLVDVCVMPRYQPAFDSASRFEWRYQIAYRHAGSNSTYYGHPSGSLWISPWEFGLIDASTNSPNWDATTAREHHEGKGKWLYEPACDDSQLCPGGDWSRYECSLCQKYVKPFSDDAGDLICPWCEATGLVMFDDEQLDRLEKVREFARSIGMSEQLERQLSYLANYADHDEPKRQCVLGYDFAPHSFSFAHFVLPKYPANGQRSFWFNGGLIYQGPTSPADGSFPSLTVSLASGTGWFCHT